MCAKIYRPKIGRDFLVQVHRCCSPSWAGLINTQCFLCLILGSRVAESPESPPGIAASKWRYSVPDFTWTVFLKRFYT